MHTITQSLLHSFKFSTVHCSRRSWCTVTVLFCAAWTAFAALFGGAVCAMCYVLLVSAGRNVLDSMPPTQCPPTRGRLCIYTSGSSRSPQSLCSFKSLPCIHPSTLFLSIIGFSGVLLQPNKHTNTHAHTRTSSHSPRTAFDENICVLSDICTCTGPYVSSNPMSIICVTVDVRATRSRFDCWRVSLKTVLEIKHKLSKITRREILSWKKKKSQWQKCCLEFLIPPPLNSPQKVRGACNWNEWSPRWFQHSVSPICAYILCYR